MSLVSQINRYRSIRPLPLNPFRGLLPGLCVASKWRMGLCLHRSLHGEQWLSYVIPILIQYMFIRRNVMYCH